MKGSRVKIRERENKDGTISIILDCHLGYYIDIDGKKKAQRKRRFLDFKLIQNPRTSSQRQQNKDYSEKARLIASQWEKSIINEEYDIEDTEKGKTLVYAYLIKEIKRMLDLVKYINNCEGVGEVNKDTIKRYIKEEYFHTKIK